MYQHVLAGLKDRATVHWVRAPPLDVGDDDDADTETDTTVPDDDNEYIASLTSQQTSSPPVLKFVTVPARPSWGCVHSGVPARPGAQRPLRRPRSSPPQERRNSPLAVEVTLNVTSPDLCLVLIQTACASLLRPATPLNLVASTLLSPRCVCFCFLLTLPTLRNSPLHSTPSANRDLHVNVFANNKNIDFDSVSPVCARISIHLQCV